MSENSNKTLAEVFADYKKFIAVGGTAYAILYTPSNCHLALVNEDGKFFKEDGEVQPELIFEARIFNAQAELRWLKGYGAAIITDDTFKNDKDYVDTNPQNYLLWGQSTGNFSADEKWTQFGEARIGAFFVPAPKIAPRGYAQITAVEYLKKYEDGNVAVADERLTGIKPYDVEVKQDA
jgi:CRISPR-associated protein (TIGR03984 family)